MTSMTRWMKIYVNRMKYRISLETVEMLLSHIKNSLSAVQRDEM